MRGAQGEVEALQQMVVGEVEVLLVPVDIVVPIPLRQEEQVDLLPGVEQVAVEVAPLKQVEMVVQEALEQQVAQDLLPLARVVEQNISAEQMALLQL